MKQISNFFEDEISKKDIGHIFKIRRINNPNAKGNYGVFIQDLKEDWMKEKAKKDKIYYQGKLVCKYFGFTTKTYCQNWIKDINTYGNKEKIEYIVLNIKDLEQK